MAWTNLARERSRATRSQQRASKLMAAGADARARGLPMVCELRGAERINWERGWRGQSAQALEQARADQRDLDHCDQLEFPREA